MSASERAHAANQPADAAANRKRPRIAVCAAFHPGCEVAGFVLAQPYPIEFVATCDRDDSPYEARIAALCDERGVECHRRVNVNEPAFITRLRERRIDLVILAWWPSIVKKEALAAPGIGWANLHPTLLPYGRGKHGYYWSVVEHTPFGVSVHLLDEGIDTGPILFQRELPVYIHDTGDTLYERGVREVVQLFKDSYARLTTLDFTPRPQPPDGGTFHWAREIEPHSAIDLERTYRAGDLLDIIRARTFLRGDSAFFMHEGRKYRVKLIIEEAPAPAATPAPERPRPVAGTAEVR
ncbi:MAG: formyltransferase family protein [Phycisphaerae bacterium]|jgi:methionyl-tRNA formyltransferase